MIEIQQMLRHAGIRTKALTEEYLDHYCSQYERMIDDGIPHERAIYTIHQEIAAFDFRAANRQYFQLHYQKPLLMTSTFLALLATLIFIPNNEAALFTAEECIETTEPIGILVSIDEPPSINPVALDQIKIYSGFGMRMHPVQKVKRFHGGIDIRAAIGTPIVAPSDGTVINAGYHKKKGNWIEIQHDDIYFTRYYHLSKIDVAVDQKITKGSKIGEVGSSGLSLSPHLHYEVIKDGKKVDPKGYIKV